jgi:hypothetical protein
VGTEPGLPAGVQERLRALQEAGFGARLWRADSTLWKPGDEAHQKVIANALGWLSVFEGVRDELAGLRDLVDELRAEGYRSAVLLGMGGSSLAPLHSTGQLHKGGANQGLFLQLLGHDPDDVEIPGQPFTFSVLKRAQARGDLAALRAHGCRALRVCLGDDVTAGLARLGELVAAAM